MASRALAWLLCLFLAASALCIHASELPAVRLRTRTLRTREHAGRRLLQQQLEQQAPREHHTRSEAWGTLRGAQQLLLTHTPQLSADGRTQLVAAVEAAGCHVAAYVPDSSLLLVGSPERAAALEAHPAVLRLALHEEQDRLAPEWRPILEQLEQRRYYRGQLTANATQAAVRAVLAQLPVAAQWDAASQQLLIGAAVSFPSLAVPAASRGLAAEAEAPRTRRVMLQRQAQDAGAGAAADWAPQLERLFGARVQRTSPETALVLAPAQQLGRVLQWLAQRPAVHWVDPAPKLRLNNAQASSITQSARPFPRDSAMLDAALHPLWAAGITGRGQVIGCGDSGLDVYHCFFVDPAIDMKVAVVDGKRTFDSPDHRKIRYYRAYADTEDSNGHGTHVSGTLVGMPYGTSLDSKPSGGYVGMAPDAKIAFIDLGDSSSDTISTPSDLANSYFPYTSGVGAAIHSDSWGATNIYYDFLARQVDLYSWENPDFLPIFAAGNDGGKAKPGTMASPAGASRNGDYTVTSPANAKNCLSVGATQTANEVMETSAVKYVVWDATVTEGDYASTFKVMQAAFGGSVSALTGGKEYAMVVAQPLEACSPLQNDGNAVKGAIVLVQRGTCAFSEKAQAAQDAGAAGVLIYDNVLQAYFTWGGTDAVAASITIPVMSVTRRLGLSLAASASVGKAVTLSFATSRAPENSFENLASYSSQGPTPDKRVKPDILAPGTITSAAVGLGSSEDCSLTTMAGTSMATPVVAGSAALVRQYFMDGFYPSGTRASDKGFTPSAALVKAVLLGGAASITGFEADTGLPVDPTPSFRQGFGRVFLGNSVYLANTPNSRPLSVVDRVPIKQDESHEYCVRANGGPLTVTLVWTDFPALASAEKALVHDLDLTVRAAGLNGIPLLGNGGSVDDPSTPDRENNVEQVTLDSLPGGPVAITVRGHSVFGEGGVPQYALVVNGDFSGGLIKPGEPGSEGQCTITVASITKGPSGVSSASPAVFEFSTQSGNAAGIRFQCKLGDSNGNITSAAHSDWRNCTSPASFDGLPDGAYQFAVRAEGEDIATTQNFVKDTVAPQVEFTSTSPAATTTDAEAVFAFSGDDATGVNFTCTLTASGGAALQPPVLRGNASNEMREVALGQPFDCASPLYLHWLLPAAWSVSVVGRDPAGNVAAPQTYSWQVAYATGALYTRFLSGPYGLQPTGSHTFNFTTLDASGQAASAAGHECWLEAVPAGGGSSAPDYKACTSPVALPADLKDGSYRFHARVAGSSGTDGTAGVTSFAIDSVAPTVTFEDAPQLVAGTNTTSLEFSSSEEGSTFFCGLSRGDAGAAAPQLPAADAFQACTSPARLANLTDGSYLFAVYAVDPVGNKGQPAAANFTVDNTPPTFTTINFPSATNQTSINVTFEAADAGSGLANITCRFRELNPAQSNSSSSGQAAAESASEWRPCTSPQQYAGLQEGRYGLTLRAADRAGLVKQTDEFDVFVDFTAPRVSTASLPPLGEKQPSDVTFKLSELSSQPEDSYSPIATYQTLVQTVADQAAYDALQNAWRGDSVSTSGTVTRNTSWGGTSGRRRSLLQSGGSDETKLPASAVGTWTNCSATCTYEGLGSGLYSLQVRAIDAAGNAGDASLAYPFEVDSSIGKSTFPLWAIIACAVGGAAAVIVLALVVWACCCRKRRTPQQGSSASPGRPSHATNGSSAWTYSPGGHSYYSNGRPAPSPGAYPSPGAANGAWGYGNGYAAASAPAWAATSDPIEQQRIALEQAHALRDQRLRAQAGGPAPPLPAGAPSAAALAPSPSRSQRPPKAVLSEEEQVAAALAVSLREQHARAAAEAEDAQLRAAIEASLRDQQRQQQRWDWSRP